MTTIVTCPHCGQTVEWAADHPFRPFCSERCKLIDLGAWASADYSVASNEPVDIDVLEQGFETLFNHEN